MLKKIFIALIEARQRQANARIAEMHLNRMSSRELRDIGISRCDIKRVIYEDLNEKTIKGTNSQKNKNNVSWGQYFYSKLGGKLHKPNHA